MKKTLSVILLSLLLAVSAFALAACGGGMSADDLANAYEAYTTAEKITLTIEDNDRHINFISDGYRLKSNVKISFDASKDAVFVSVDYFRFNLIEAQNGRGTYEMYYVLDGANVIQYKRNTGVGSPNWELINVEKFSTQEQAMTCLRNKYLNAQNVDEYLFPTFTELTFDETYTKSFLASKYTWKLQDNRFKYTYELNFKDGKVTEFTYQHKTSNAGYVDDTRKFSMKIEYSADIPAPTGLPQA